MVNWKDPEVVAYGFFLYEQIAVFLLGFYGTQFLCTWNVEWEFITRKRVFKVIHIPYLLARYITLCALLFFVISARIKIKISCDFAYRAFAILGCLAIMLASLTICCRPVMIFIACKMYTPLYILGLGGLGQLFLVISQGVWSVRARWDPELHVCTISAWQSTFLAVQYLYTFVYDVVILLATLLAVRRVHDGRREGVHWGLGDALRMQGLWYLVVTCIANVPVAVLSFLNLNAAMDVLLSMPAMTISVIAASLATLTLKEGDLQPMQLPGGFAAHEGSNTNLGHHNYEPASRELTTHIHLHPSLISTDSIQNSAYIKTEDPRTGASWS